MENDAQKIREKLRAFVKPVAVTMLGEVTEVDESEQTCTITDDGTDYYNVRLQCVTAGDSGLLLVPKVGTMAMAVQIEDNSGWMLIQCAEIDRMQLKVCDNSLEIGEAGIVVNNGTVGAAKADAIVKQLNTLEQRCNDIVTAIKGINIALAPSGTFPLAPYMQGLTDLDKATGS